MDELLLRYLRGQTTDEEKRSVEAWLHESPDAGRELDELRLLVEAGRAADLDVEPGATPATDLVVRSAEARRAASIRRANDRRARGRPARSRFGLLAGWATAAAAVVVALGIYASNRPGGTPEPGALAAQEFITAPGETAMVRLGDGSVIRLGPASRLSTPTGDLARTVTLEGEAFFSIATNPARPFRVTTAAGTARVLGTRFHLAAQLAELRVVVVEGTVALGTATEEIQVGAGQAASLIDGRPGPIRAASPFDEAASWLDGFLIFQDTPLTLAIREVEQRYDARVEVEDPVLLERTLSMWFTSRSLDEIMTVVCNVIDAQCSIADGTVRMRSRDTDGSR